MDEFRNLLINLSIKDWFKKGNSLIALRFTTFSKLFDLNCPINALASGALYGCLNLLIIDVLVWSLLA